MWCGASANCLLLVTNRLFELLNYAHFSAVRLANLFSVNDACKLTNIPETNDAVPASHIRVHVLLHLPHSAHLHQFEGAGHVLRPVHWTG